MPNPKIEKVSAEIAKANERLEDYKAKAVELAAKIKDLEQQKITLENDEVIALFRREKFNEDEFAALLRSQRRQEQPDNSSSADHETVAAHEELKEENSENEE
jgi:hypothetical protein